MLLTVLVFVKSSPFALELKGGETFRLRIMGAHGFLFCSFLCLLFPLIFFLSATNFPHRTFVLRNV